MRKKLSGCSPACCGRQGLAAVQGREDVSVDGTSQPPAGRGSWSGSGPCTASPQEAPYRGASLFLGTEPLGWKTQEAGEFSAPCKSFLLLSLADTWFLPRLIPASVEASPRPIPHQLGEGGAAAAGARLDSQRQATSSGLMAAPASKEKHLIPTLHPPRGISIHSHPAQLWKVSGLALRSPAGQGACCQA